MTVETKANYDVLLKHHPTSIYDLHPRLEKTNTGQRLKYEIQIGMNQMC